MMSRFSERVTGDLREIADHMTPSPAALESIRTRIDSRTDQPDLEVTMLSPDQKSPSRRTQLALGALAAAVLVTVGLVVVTSRDDVDVAVDPAQQPGSDGVDPAESASNEALGIARSFVEARDAWDGEAVRALVADDATINGFVETPDDYLTNNEFERVTGWRFIDPECTVEGAEVPTEVTCSYTMKNVLSEALGVGPFIGSTFAFVIADGTIQELTHDFVFQTGYSVQVSEVFLAWIRSNHPEDVALMYDFGPVDYAPMKTPEAIALWEQYANEFVAEQQADS